MALFISLEGGEGSGKTTQINKLASGLMSEGYRVITTREPGGTEEGERIRSLLVQRETGNWNAISETLMLFAARSIHIERVIKPALARGEIVISDRFTDSTLAYQGYGHGLDRGKIKTLSFLAIDDFTPDLTFILDIDVDIGLERSSKRMENRNGFQSTEDRYERLGQKFHERIRQGFLDIAREEPSRCHVLDASLNIDILAKKILDITLEKLSGV